MKRAFLIAMLFTGCAKILDLEDRTLSEAGTPGPGPSDGGSPDLLDGGAPLGCATYCDNVMALCPAGPVREGFAVFEKPAHCAAVCALYPPGDPATATGNTLACRQKLLNEALRFGEATAICQGAGPGGTGFQSAASCGSNCENFCNLRLKVCDEVDPDCLRKCSALPDPQENSYNAGVDFNSQSDTFNCRMAHLAVATDYRAAGDDAGRLNHCEHSGYRSTAPCEPSAEAVPLCKDYCKIVMAGCADTSRVYETQQQCEAVCAKFPNASKDSKMDNTLRCRREGAYNVLLSSPSPRGCEAAGPVPLECGGSKCASFCSMLLDPTTCGTDGPFKTQDECVANCDQIADSKANRQINYLNGALTDMSNDTLSCRVRNLMQAIGSNDKRFCTNAFGTGSCK